MILKKVFLSLLIIGIATAGPTILPRQAAAADTDVTGRWGFGLEFGDLKLIEGEWDYSTVDQFVGMHLSKGLSDQWTLAFALQYGYVRPGAEFPGDETGFSGASTAPLYTTILQPSVKLQHRFAPASRITPVLGVGLGMTKWRVMNLAGQDVGLIPSGDPISGYDTNGRVVSLDGSELTILLELGLDVTLTESLTLNLGGRYGVMPGNEKDNIGLGSQWGADHVDANTGLAEAFVGLTWWLGSGDRDRDGVPNDRDQCPDEPEDRDGYNDNDGCPDLDNDNDGVLDADDACPTRAEDRDGYQDDDGCPDPDNDGDGIYDNRDQCPDEAEDVDGWEDQDGCPDLDNDQDGVPDDRDQCPRTPADSKVDDNGCVVEIPPAKTAAVFVPAATAGTVLEGVSFVSGSAELTLESVTVLIDLAASLKAEPTTRIEIRGHTDSTGEAEANRVLSQRRAEAVRNSLVQMGVAADRLTAVGYGEDFPRDNNATAEGRANNRRVEIHRR